MSDRNDEDNSRRRRRSSLSRGRRSLVGGVIEESQNFGKLREILAYEKYKDDLEMECDMWENLAKKREMKVESTREDGRKDLTRAECRLGLTEQNRLDARLDYAKVIHRALKYDSAAATYSSFLLNGATIFAEASNSAEQDIQRAQRKMALAILGRQRPISQILAELATYR